ncbi:MAG: SRPBCC family protein [Anaerolineae bacterium]|jgi:hypothetical protein|nr:SRPBCC family protein [Anaerolineae bacterium]
MARVLNVHTRPLAADRPQVGRLLAGLASAEDRLWPHQHWPAMRFDRPLAAGAVGGHGPIRYVIEQYTPDAHIIFRFTAPAGFVGTHAYYIDALPEGGVLLRHVLAMQTHGPARFTWPLIFRPLHDALIEDSLNQAAAQVTGTAPATPRWSPWVRLLRALLRRRPPRRRH